MKRLLLLILLILARTVSMYGQEAVCENTDTTRVSVSGFRFTGSTPYSSFSTASRQVYTSKDLNFTPSLDLRTSFVNIPGARVVESGAPGLQSTVYFFEGGSFSIDGMDLAQGTEHPSVDEIESITAVCGVIDRIKLGMGNGFYINTALGNKEGCHISVNAESAFLFSGRTAEWCKGAEFAEMMNTSRLNAGLPVIFSQEQIDGFAKGDPYDTKYPSVDMYDLTIRDWRSSQKASVSLDGREGRTSYFCNMNYLREGDNLKVGPVSDYNSINIRGNLRTNFTPYLSLDIRSVLSLDIRRIPCAGFNIGASVYSPVDYPLTIEAGDDSGKLVYGVSKLVPDNYYAALVESGSNTGRTRLGSVKSTLAYDFSKYVRGLVSETFVGFMMSGKTTDGTTKDYLAYYYEPSSDSWLPSAVHQGVSSSAKAVKSTSYLQNLKLRETIKYSRRKNDNRLEAQAWAQMTNYQTPSARTRGVTFSASVDYSFKNRYLAQLVYYAPGSSEYKSSERFASGVGAGVAWTISNEEWMKSLGWISHLKLMAQFGSIPLDVVTSHYLYMDSYAKSGSYTSGVSAVDYSWIANQGNSASKEGTVISRFGNESLGRGRQHEVNAGLEGSFFDRRLNVFANLFCIHNTGLLANGTPLLPDFYGMNGTISYINWNSVLATMANYGVSWSERLGNIRYEISYWGGKQKSLRDRYLETVINDYNKVEGTYSSCLRGYDYIGRFASQEDIDSSPKQTFDSRTKVGDLKYRDIDGNGIIDSNDITVLEKEASGWLHNIRLGFGIKNFDCLFIFRARTGSTISLQSCGFFTGGRGYVNYTTWMRDNLGGEYPSLAYEGNNGNYQSSQFWFRSGDFLKLRNVEMGYSIPGRGMRVFLRAENLFSIDHIKVLDPEYLSAGYSTYALNRSASVGITIGMR